MEEWRIMERIKTGVIGCGSISSIYFENMSGVFNGMLEVTACADLDMSRAKAAAAKYPGVRAMSVRKLLANQDSRQPDRAQGARERGA